MEFFAIIISVGLLQYWGSATPIHYDAWFRRYVKTIQHLPFIYFKLLLSFLLPIGFVWVLANLVGHSFFGIPRLLLLVVLLLYSMGRGNFSAAITDYIASWRHGDLQGAYHNFIKSRRGNAEPAAICSAGELHFNARIELFYRLFERFFVPLFYFALFGFALALLYRLLVLYRDQELCVIEDRNSRRDMQIVNCAIAVLEWLPARLLGLTFAVMGDFAAGLKSWQSTALSTSMQSKHILNDNGCAAIDLDLHCEATAPAQEAAPDAFSESAVVELQSIQQLYKRSALFWIGCIAILQIF